MNNRTISTRLAEAMPLVAKGACIGNVVGGTGVIVFNLAYYLAPHLFKELSNAAYRGIVLGTYGSGWILGAGLGACMGLVANSVSSASTEAEYAVPVEVTYDFLPPDHEEDDCTSDDADNYYFSSDLSDTENVDLVSPLRIKGN